MRRVVNLGQGVLVRAVDGTVAALVPGPHGQGIRITVKPHRIVTTRQLADLRTDGSVGRGRPATATTMELRRQLMRDRDDRQIGSPQEYIEFLVARGHSPAAARQTVRREMTRLLGRRHRPVDAERRGRRPSKAAGRLRLLLENDHAQGTLKTPAAYVPALRGAGLTAKAARSLVYRELRRLRTRRRPPVADKGVRSAQ